VTSIKEKSIDLTVLAGDRSSILVAGALLGQPFRLSYRERRDFWAFQNPRCPLLALRRHSGRAVYQGLGAGGVATPPWTRQRVPASAAVVSPTSKSWVIVAVLAIIADAEQYFSTDSAMARSIFSSASPRPFTTKCM
jgi:hypothetical protein